jgi:hypothetical protein
MCALENLGVRSLIAVSFVTGLTVLSLTSGCLNRSSPVFRFLSYVDSANTDQGMKGWCFFQGVHPLSLKAFSLSTEYLNPL